MPASLSQLQACEDCLFLTYFNLSNTACNRFRAEADTIPANFY